MVPKSPEAEPPSLYLNENNFMVTKGFMEQLFMGLRVYLSPLGAKCRHAFKKLTSIGKATGAGGVKERTANAWRALQTCALAL